MKLEMVHLVVGPLETNCYLVAEVTSGRTAVIDPGDEPWRIQHELTMREWTLDWALITHAHFDHIAACGELVQSTGCRIALHSADLPLWWIGGMGEMFGIKIPGLPTPERTINKEESLQLGEANIDILHLPGHSPGHSGFLFRDTGWLFCGDLLFAEGGRGRTDLPGGDEQLLIRSIENKVLPLPDDTQLFPGHGPFTTIGKERGFWRSQTKPVRKI